MSTRRVRPSGLTGGREIGFPSARAIRQLAGRLGRGEPVALPAGRGAEDDPPRVD